MVAEEVNGRSSVALGNESNGTNKSEEVQQLGCPPEDIVRNLVQAYVETLWVRMWCKSAFLAEVDASARVEMHPFDVGACEVLYRHVQGQVRLLLNTSLLAGEPDDVAPASELATWPALDKFVANASMRLAAGDAWAPIDRKLCAFTPRAGYLSLLQPLAKDALHFTLSALNENRRVHGCVGNLSLQELEGMEGPIPVSGIVGRASVLHFSLVVRNSSKEAESKEQLPVKGTTPSAQWVVRVAVEAFASIRNASQTVAFIFLGSEPAPCSIIGGRRYAPGSPVASWRKAQPSAQGTPLLHVAQRKEALEAVEEQLRLVPGIELLTRNILRVEGKAELPENFSFRDRAPRSCLLKVRRQGRCIGGWALAAVGSFEKQACVLSNGSVQLRLSAQDALECATGRAGCGGGRLEDAFQHIFAEGAVEEECVPWSASPGRDSEDPADLQAPTSSLTVPRNSSTPFSDEAMQAPGRRCSWLGAARGDAMWSGRKPCRRLLSRLPTDIELRVTSSIWPRTPPGIMTVRGERMIQAAIFTYAAVASNVEVYADFLSYTGGVYHRNNNDSRRNAADFRGLTAVQLIGWGRAMDGASAKPYWLGENSFGDGWGEDGFFRWYRGSDHLGIERRALFGLVEGLHPFAPLRSASSTDVAPASDASIAALSSDSFSELLQRAAAHEARVQELERWNWCLAVGAILSFTLAAAAFFVVLRRCLCPAEEEEEEEEPGGKLLVQ